MARGYTAATEANTSAEQNLWLMSEPRDPAGEPPPPLRCDTCGRPTPVVSRVVVAPGYNRANARPLYNCPDCYEQKNRARKTILQAVEKQLS